jgi:hypothetical protein
MHLSLFRDLLATRFTLAELQSLCLDLGIPYEELPGDTLTEKIEGLIGYTRRREMLPQLWERCRALRPIVGWPALDGLLEDSRAAPLPAAPAMDGSSYQVHVGGNVGPNAQLAVGQNINQFQTGQRPSAAELLADLRAAIRAELAPETAEAAEREVAVLQEELGATEPNLTRLSQLREYFLALGGRVATAAAAVFKSEPAQAALKTAAEIAVAAALKGFGG